MRRTTGGASAAAFRVITSPPPRQSRPSEGHRWPSDGRDCRGGGEVITRNAAAEAPPVVLRIGEVAKLTGLTTRTLRYWEEQGLISPSSYRGRGERLYSATDMARVTRIRDLQELLGFSLAEVRVVLETEY